MPVFDLDTKLRIRNDEYFLTFMFSNDFEMRKNDWKCFDLSFDRICQREKESERMET